MITKTQQLAIWIGIICVVLLLAFNQINSIYPANFLYIIFFTCILPSLIIVCSFIFLKRFYKYDNNFKNLFLIIFGIFPAIYIGNLLRDFSTSELNNSNLILCYGTIFILIILYIIIALFSLNHLKK